MLYMTKEERLISLEKMTNTRDLGGYETRNGAYTKAHKYIRASSPANATKKDLEDLYKYGIKATIDLRSDFEKFNQPSLLKGYKDIDYYEINLLDQKNIKVVPDDVRKYKDLGGLYIYMLEASKVQIKQVFDIFLKYPYEAILFHCSAGKDRTGLIAALLLELAGCHEYDIVKDYSESYENNRDINQELAKMMDEDKVKYLKSAPQYMMELLYYLQEHYGSSYHYLLDVGLKEEDIQELIENFVI